MQKQHPERTFKTTTYGAPVASLTVPDNINNKRYRNYDDAVSMFDRGSTMSVKNPLTLQNYLNIKSPSNIAEVAKNVTSLNSAPTPENIMLRSQERETGNRANIGNVINKTKGAIKRIEDQLKTTNKELTLYEYKGTASSSNKKPENREAWYQNETKTKETREHTPSGSKIGAPGVGVEAYNFESKSRVGFENYMGSQAVYVQPSTHNIGETSHSKLDNDTIDYTSRLSDNRQMRSFDRPNGSITNNNF